MHGLISACNFMRTVCAGYVLLRALIYNVNVNDSVNESMDHNIIHYYYLNNAHLIQTYGVRGTDSRGAQKRKMHSL